MIDASLVSAFAVEVDDVEITCVKGRRSFCSVSEHKFEFYL
jgi:hypothetical protein